MEKFRQSILVKSMILITIVIFVISSLSIDFMFNILGVTNDALVYNYLYQSCIIGGEAVGWNIENRKEAGVFAMLVLLLLIVTFYILYRALKAIYKNYITAHKAFQSGP